MKEIWIKFKKDVTLEKIVVKLILSWLCTSLIFALKVNAPIMNAEFAANINIGMYISFLALFFVFFCAVSTVRNFVWVETFGPLILITIYGTIGLNKNPNVSYFVGIMFAVAVSLAYAISKTKAFADIKKKSTVISVYIVAALVYVAIAGTTTVLRYLNYYAPAFDFGIWCQMFQNMKEGFAPVTTVEREFLMSHFEVHVSPIYYVYLPIYFIFPYPVTLQILQVLTLASGLIPIYLLCKKMGLTKTATAGFGLIYALYPALATGCYYDLHENCFLVPLILWLFYFIEKDNLKGMIIFSILVVLVKEDAPVYLACIGLYLMLGKKKYVKGAVMMCFAIVYFIGVTFYLKYYGQGVMTNRYNNFMTENGQGLFWVIRNFVTNPVYAIKECFKTDRFEFILYMLVPTGFLPIISKKIANYILLIPFFIVNLAPDYIYQHSIFFQYVFGTLAIFMYLAIINYSEMSEKLRRYFCGIALCAAIVIMPLGSLSRTWHIEYFTVNREELQELNEMVKSIPEDKSVSASTFFVPHFYKHDELYEYPYLYNKDIITDYVVIDIRNGKVSLEEQKKLEEKGYVFLEKRNNLYMIFVQKSQNP